MINRDTCEHCAAFHTIPGGGNGECRLKAPQPVALPQSDGQLLTLGVFPATRKNNWCLEWRPHVSSFT